MWNCNDLLISEISQTTNGTNLLVNNATRTGTKSAVKFPNCNIAIEFAETWCARNMSKCTSLLWCYQTYGTIIRQIIPYSQTQFSHIINRLLTSLVRSVLSNIRAQFFAWTSLLRRSVHTKKPRSDISQYRPHARSISRYNSVRKSIFIMPRGGGWIC
jgi:hypothetical protein